LNRLWISLQKLMRPVIIDAMITNYPTIEQTVGNTPLVPLQRIPGAAIADRGNVILVKLEGNNPAGSVKDRPALSMILDAEA
jgi:S-sulfo-L-cysteine synthase (O-acetyl-L-serine-dependent)